MSYDNVYCGNVYFVCHFYHEDGGTNSSDILEPPNKLRGVITQKNTVRKFTALNCFVNTEIVVFERIFSRFFHGCFGPVYFQQPFKFDNTPPAWFLCVWSRTAISGHRRTVSRAIYTDSCRYCTGVLISP